MEWANINIFEHIGECLYFYFFQSILHRYSLQVDAFLDHNATKNIRSNFSTTTMAVGESVTPVLRPGVVSSDVIPQAPPPGVPVVGPPTQVPGFNPAMNNHANAPPLPVQGNPYQPQQQGHNGLPNSNPFESGPGPQDSPMHQISLTSPPHVPTNMRNAEFYWNGQFISLLITLQCLFHCMLALFPFNRNLFLECNLIQIVNMITKYWHANLQKNFLTQK